MEWYIEKEVGKSKLHCSISVLFLQESQVLSRICSLEDFNFLYSFEETFYLYLKES